MKVADLQKYLRALAEAVSAAKGLTAKDLADVANQLGPFANLSVADFAQFLQLAWEYKTTGKIAEPQYSKGGRGGVVSKAAKGSMSPADAVGRVKALYDRATDPAMTREYVECEVRTLASLTKAQLDSVAAGSGFAQKFKKKDDVLRALVGYVLGRKGAVERADA